MKNQITITVSARQGVGKTTVADLLARFLLEQGFKVEMEDQFGTVPPNFFKPNSCYDRKKAVVDNFGILIKEVLVRGDSPLTK